jgi:hypothetical protein
MRSPLSFFGANRTGAPVAAVDGRMNPCSKAFIEILAENLQFVLRESVQGTMVVRDLSRLSEGFCQRIPESRFWEPRLPLAMSRCLAKAWTGDEGGRRRQ